MAAQFTDSGAREIPGLDHLGLYAQDMGAIAAQYQRLGFQLTPLSQHSGLDSVTGQMVKSGIANRCAMLRRGYIELLAVVDPALDRRGLPAGLARYAGLHILAFRTADAERTIAALGAAGMVASYGALQRQVETPEGPRVARFSQVRTPAGAMPEGLVLTLRHETPELLWQEPYLEHPNGALGLDEVVVAVEELEEAAARYARYFGCQGSRDDGAVRFALDSGAFVLVDRATLEERFPGIEVPLLPFPAAMTVSVADLERTASVLRANQVRFERRGGRVHVGSAEAGGIALVFQEEE